MGAGVALLVSFAVLALAWRSPRWSRTSGGRELPLWFSSAVDSRWLRGLVRGFGLAVTAWTAWAALAGQESSANPTLGVFYVFLWVGLVPLSLVVGNVWPLLSPVRTIHVGLSWLLRTPPDRGPLDYPRWLGCWPAAAALFTFVWTELVNPDAEFVSTVVTWVLVYAAVLVVGASVFGDTFLAHADPFEVWFGLVAKLSPWGRRLDLEGRSRVLLRNPLASLDSVTPKAGQVALVSVLLGSTAYDSFSRSTFWLSRKYAPGALDNTTRDTLLLAGFVVVVAVTFTVAARVGSGSRGAQRRELPGLLVHSLVPIGVGYVFAHYLTLLLETGQAYLIFLSDPLVTETADYFGTADWTVSYFLSQRPGLLATLKVAGVLVGHLLAVVAAHDRALRVLPLRSRVRGQLAMLVLMLGYTVGGLLLLFSV